MEIKNPVILCDYSDPDVIRIDETFYLVASSFNFFPGLPILSSKNLQDWQLVNYACPTLPMKKYDDVQNARGIWAPSIRAHGGKYYIFFGTPDEGLFFVSADDILGKWSEAECVWSGKGFEDPCPIWTTDENGKERVFLVHAYVKSRIGFNSKLGILELDPVSLKAISEDKIIFDGSKTQPTIEGPKVYERNGFFYIFAPAGGVTDGWQTVLRSRSLFGNWEERIVLRQGKSRVNGPHQGAFVELTDKMGVFVHFQERGVFGRIVHVQPLFWEDDDWCKIGDAIFSKSECGEPLDDFSFPQIPYKEKKEKRLAKSQKVGFGGFFSDFQFSANPKKYAEFEKKSVRLFAANGQKSLWETPNVLSKKIDAENFRVCFCLDVSDLGENAFAGAFFFGDCYRSLEIFCKNGGFFWRVLEGFGSGDNERCEKILETGTIPPFDLKNGLKFSLLFKKIDERTGNSCVTLQKSSGEVLASTDFFRLEKAHWVGGRFGIFVRGFSGSAVFSVKTQNRSWSV